MELLHVIDISKCATGDHNCDPYDATCTDTPSGGFTCSCREGYTGDGFNCKGECKILLLL